MTATYVAWCNRCQNSTDHSVKTNRCLSPKHRKKADAR